MQIDDGTAVAKSKHNSREHQFCSQDCKRQFDEHPECYTGSRHEAAARSVPTCGGSALGPLHFSGVLSIESLSAKIPRIVGARRPANKQRLMEKAVELLSKIGKTAKVQSHAS